MPPGAGKALLCRTSREELQHATLKLLRPRGVHDAGRQRTRGSWCGKVTRHLQDSQPPPSHPCRLPSGTGQNLGCVCHRSRTARLSPTRPRLSLTKAAWGWQTRTGHDSQIFNYAPYPSSYPIAGFQPFNQFHDIKY